MIKLKTTAAVLGAALLASCTPVTTSPEMEPFSLAYAGEAFCRPTPNGRLMTGCYLDVSTTADDRLLSVTTPVADRVEIHESKTEGGMMTMAELPNGLQLDGGRPVQLRPGGTHLMLLGLSDPLTVGETVTLTLNFQLAKPVEVVAQVAQPPAD